jgi:molybdate transport system regulatory protein
MSVADHTAQRCGVIQPDILSHRPRDPQLAAAAHAAAAEQNMCWRSPLSGRKGFKVTTARGCDWSIGAPPAFFNYSRLPCDYPTRPGCGTEVLMSEVSVSFRVEFGPHCAIGPGKIALLENIERTGSLSEAARRLQMSYRRAWLLLEDLNTAFQQPVARMSVGGRGGGGASLTSFGSDLVSAYRALEAHIHKRAQTAFPASMVPVSGEPQRHRPVPKRRVTRPADRPARSHAKR